MTQVAKRILLASGNKKKLTELSALLGPLGIDLVQPAELGGLPKVIEDQPDFAGNARKKAVSAAKATGHWSLADDSGLEVDHLHGAPGVHSARYAGEHGNDGANNTKLLGELAGVPKEERTAQFVCALALANPQGDVLAEIQGIARGHIIEAPRGSGDFGYDPLFEFSEEGFPATGKTFAELDPSSKLEVSHRGRALRELASQLNTLLAHDA